MSGMMINYDLNSVHMRLLSPQAARYRIQLKSYNFISRYNWLQLDLKYFKPLQQVLVLTPCNMRQSFTVTFSPVEETAYKYIYSPYLHSWFCISSFVEPRRVRYILKCFWRHKVQRANLCVKLYARLVSL